MKWVLIVSGGLLGLALVAAAVWYWLASNVERPDYQVLSKDGAFEIRRYPALVVAEATTRGTRETAVRAGFRRLADYIFAKDRAGETIAMTAPVTQRPEGAPGGDETIAMTAPVTQTPAGTGAPGEPGLWRVQFIMPARYSLAELPAPADEAVRLRELPPRRVAALRFSGRWRDALMAAKAAELRRRLEAEGLTPAGPVTYAYYNDPFTPGFLRRNEVMVELAPE